tara:strand:- start:739 stop:1809 length:1071 start_codon:yes stop_codon:yes gene_type:complete
MDNTKIIKPYVVCIPTYKRYKLVLQQTLKTLFLNNISSNLVYLFVANENEKKKYKSVINNYLINNSIDKNINGKSKKKNKKNNKKLLKNKKTSKRFDKINNTNHYNNSNINNSNSNNSNSNNSNSNNSNNNNFNSKKSKIQKNKFNKYIKNINIVVGFKGLKNQRNYISQYFSNNQKILQLDDDVKDILKLKYDVSDPKNRKKYSLHSIKNLHKFIVNAFNTCINNNIYLWGIYPVNNAYFMKPDKSFNLKFIVGPMFGIINRKNKDLKLTVDEKENVERTLQYYNLDKKVLRFNNVTIKTTYFKTPGGMQSNKRNDVQRMKNALKSAEYLHKKYPHMTKIYLGKKSGWPELKLIN